jgi:hypothetical protein
VPAIACNHCKKPRCHLCHLYATNAHYRALWGGEAVQARGGVRVVQAPPRPARDPHKPRVNIADLAQKRRH